MIWKTWHIRYKKKKANLVTFWLDAYMQPICHLPISFERKNSRASDA